MKAIVSVATKPLSSIFVPTLYLVIASAAAAASFEALAKTSAASSGVVPCFICCRVSPMSANAAGGTPGLTTATVPTASSTADL